MVLSSDIRVILATLKFSSLGISSRVTEEMKLRECGFSDTWLRDVALVGKCITPVLHVARADDPHVTYGRVAMKAFISRSTSASFDRKI